MSQFGGGPGKNPPWVRQGQSMGMGVSQQSQMQQQMMPQMGNTAAAMLQYPQTQMYQQAQMGQLQQSGLAMQTMGSIGASQMAGAGGLSGTIQAGAGALQQQQMYSQVGTVSYPTRTLITAPFTGGAGNAGVAAAGAGNSANTGSQKQRVFTGTVTKVQDNFGFVDEEVFFQTSCCVKGSNPAVGDRVLVEAMYNASMPFKWNATRLQVLPMDQRNNDPPRVGNRGGYNSVPPPSDDMLVGVGGGGGDFGRRNRNKRNRENDFDRRPIPQNDDLDRKRRREDRRSDERSNRSEKDREREKEKEKEKEKERARSPRKRSKTPKRRKARIVPRYMVQIPKIALDMPEADVMEIKKRYTNLYVPSDFFVSSFKWVEVFPPHRPITLERPCAFHVMHKDVDPIIENDSVLDPPDVDYTFSAKVMLLSMPELSEIYQRCCALADEKEASQDERDFVHPTRLINFLVGLRGKNETMAIGGPWSPSLDGPNPEKDPTVLIKTAIRTCKALTGIDLKSCSQWYRFVEIYYHRAESVHKGKTVPARVETVVLYLPDVWNCLPTRLEWDGLHLNYKKQLDRLLNNAEEEAEADEKDTSTTEVQKREPTHYAQLDPKVMKVNELREELEARSLSSKGLKSQLTARLAKALKTEQDKEEEENAAKNEAEKASGKAEKDEKEEEKKKKEEEEKKKLDEKDKQLIEKRYTLPDKSHILVHPSRTAKSGKFDCTTMSLSLLLDYRPEDSKEHSFEVSLFAELFNEMLMRDFGFCIYKALMEAPEKPKEEKDDKSKDKDKKSDKDKEKKENDDKKEEKKDEKKEDKKDEKNSVEEEDNGSGDDDDSKKDKKDGEKGDKKKKEKPKLITVDPYLLLAFVYFDQTHCGYIFDKDLEELLFTLGLNLSRAQVKKLVQKIISRDSLHYRKLTDKPKDDPSITQNGVKTLEDVITLALGNKRLFPVFDEGSSPSKRNRKGGSEKKEATELPSGFVMYNGSLLDVNNLQAQVKRSEESRLSTEKVLERTRSENAHMKEKTSQHISTIKKLSVELKDFKERLTNTNSELCNMDGKTKLYFAVMNEIYEKLGPIVAPPKPLQTRDEDVEDVEMEDASDNTQGIKQPKETSTVQKFEAVNVKQEKHEQPKAESLQQTKVLVKSETAVPEANKSETKVEEANNKPETEAQEAKKSETNVQEVNKPESEVKSAETNQCVDIKVKPEASDVIKQESKDTEDSKSIVKTEGSPVEEKSTEEDSSASPRTRSGNKPDEKKTPGKK